MIKRAQIELVINAVRSAATTDEAGNRVLRILNDMRHECVMECVEVVGAISTITDTQAEEALLGHAEKVQREQLTESPALAIARHMGISMTALALTLRRDSDTPFTWALMKADGEPYYSEMCVGSESDIREEALNHNDCADMADESTHIYPVPLYLHDSDRINWRDVLLELPDTVDGFSQACIARRSYLVTPDKREQVIVHDWYNPHRENWELYRSEITHWIYASDLMKTIRVKP